MMAEMKEELKNTRFQGLIKWQGRNTSGSGTMAIYVGGGLMLNVRREGSPWPEFVSGTDSPAAEFQLLVTGIG